MCIDGSLNLFIYFFLFFSMFVSTVVFASFKFVYSHILFLETDKAICDRITNRFHDLRLNINVVTTDKD